MADAKRDSNRITTLLAVSSVDGETPVVLWADPTTHRLLVSATAGDLLNNTVGTANTWGLVKSVNDAYNATHGQVWLTQTILGHRAGATANPGTGQLATITFTVDGPTGTTPLSLVDTKLVGYNYAARSIHAIAHTTTDGSVTISAASEFIFGLALEIALMGAVIYVWRNGKHKRKQLSLPSI